MENHKEHVNERHQGTILYAFSLSIHVATGEGLDSVPEADEPVLLALVHAVQVPRPDADQTPA